MRIECSRSSSGNKRVFLKIPIDPSQHASVRETDKAWGFEINDHMIWFPKSQIEDFQYRRNEHENHIEFWCPLWLVTEKSMEVFVDTSYEPGLFE